MESKLLEERFRSSESIAHDAAERARTKGSVSASGKLRGAIQSILIWIVGLCLAFAGGWWLANRQSTESHKISLPPIESAEKSTSMKVSVQPIVFRSIRRVVEAVGTIHGFEELSVSAKIEGRVVRIHHDLADRVEPGALLLEIDRTDAQLAVEQSERSLQAELAKWGFKQVPKADDDLSKLPTVVSAKLRADLAQSRLQRMLSIAASKTLSVEDVEQAKSEAKVTESEWNNQLLMAQSAAATARLKEADLAIARQRLNETEIQVPTPSKKGATTDQQYSISERMVSEGMMVRPGMELFKLVLGRTLKLKLSLPEVYGPVVREGQSVEIKTSATTKQIIGKVVRISPAIDPTTRTFKLEVEVPNEDLLLKPGGFARASILIGIDEDVPTIPVTALDTFAGINKIFLIEKGIAKEVKVKIGEQFEDRIEIISPAIPNGGLVATSAQRLLSDGATVSIREGSSDHAPDVASGTVAKP